MKSYTVNETVRFVQNQSISRIEVPSLAEKRPSVLPGDVIYAWVPNSDCEYEGLVFRVEQDHVLLNFTADFHQKYVSD